MPVGGSGFAAGSGKIGLTLGLMPQLPKIASSGVIGQKQWSNAEFSLVCYG
jgi:hypothetical protein